MFERILLFLLNIEQKKLIRKFGVAVFEYDRVCLTDKQTSEVLEIKEKYPDYIKDIDKLSKVLKSQKKS